MTLNEMDERYVKRIEYIEEFTKIKKDISIIKYILGIIAVSSIAPIVEKIVAIIF